jgi:hypothetical protein
LVRIGDEYEEQNVKILIREVLPYFNAAGTPSFMIGYIIQDGKYTSPLAHFWMEKSKDIRVAVRKEVEYYLSIRAHLMGAPQAAPAPSTPAPARTE